MLWAKHTMGMRILHEVQGNFQMLNIDGVVMEKQNTGSCIGTKRSLAYNGDAGINSSSSTPYTWGDSGFSPDEGNASKTLEYADIYYGEGEGAARVWHSPNIRKPFHDFCAGKVEASRCQWYEGMRALPEAKYVEKALYNQLKYSCPQFPEIPAPHLYEQSPQSQGQVSQAYYANNNKCAKMLNVDNAEILNMNEDQGSKDGNFNFRNGEDSQDSFKTEDSGCIQVTENKTQGYISPAFHSKFRSQSGTNSSGTQTLQIVNNADEEGSMMYKFSYADHYQFFPLEQQADTEESAQGNMHFRGGDVYEVHQNIAQLSLGDPKKWGKPVYEVSPQNWKFYGEGKTQVLINDYEEKHSHSLQQEGAHLNLEDTNYQLINSAVPPELFHGVIEETCLETFQKSSKKHSGEVFAPSHQNTFTTPNKNEIGALVSEPASANCVNNLNIPQTLDIQGLDHQQDSSLAAPKIPRRGRPPLRSQYHTEEMTLDSTQKKQQVTPAQKGNEGKGQRPSYPSYQRNSRLSLDPMLSNIENTIKLAVPVGGSFDLPSGFKCPFTGCNKVIKYRWGLKAHIWTHCGLRTHICPICGAGFMRRNDLIRHMRRHTNEKPHTCELCGKTFSRSDALKKHLYTDDSLHMGKNKKRRVAPFHSPSASDKSSSSNDLQNYEKSDKALKCKILASAEIEHQKYTDTRIPYSDRQNSELVDYPSNYIPAVYDCIPASVDSSTYSRSSKEKIAGYYTVDSLDGGNTYQRGRCP